MLMLFGPYVVQVNVYMMLIDEDENDHLALVDRVIFLPQKMYNQARKSQMNSFAFGNE
jgi:hypothetical protein